MLLTYFNVRGLGRGPKKAALNQFLETYSPAMILVQETMIGVVEACSLFLSIKLAWSVCALDAHGHSRGSLVAWDPRVANFKSFTSVAGILVEGFFRGSA